MKNNKESLARQLESLGLEDLASDLGVVIERALDRFLTSDASMLEMKERVKKLSKGDINILIVGESGVGKELIARGIHETSGAKGRFVGVNCAGIPNELLESEFFGSKKGAYTGSWADRKGLISEAHEGTLFLDEIGDMPLLLQCKLLRAIEDKTYRRLGDTEDLPITCRFVSATNKSLDDLGIRRDLFYRLAGSIVEIIPLRRRRQDVELILAKNNLDTSSWDNPFAWSLEEWPGNVRELLNRIKEYKLLNS